MNHKWSEREDEILFSLTGDLPWSFVVTTYHQWAKSESYPYRTPKAMLRRVHVHGYSAKSTGEWIDAAGVGELLGIEGNTVRRWIKNGWLRGHHEGVKWYVSRKNLRALARARPHLFQGRPASDLNQLLCDHHLAEQLSEHHQRLRQGARSRIKCLDTGRVYPSMADAAKKLFVHRQALSKAMREDRPCLGMRWQFVR